MDSVLLDPRTRFPSICAANPEVVLVVALKPLSFTVAFPDGLKKCFQSTPDQKVIAFEAAISSERKADYEIDLPSIVKAPDDCLGAVFARDAELRAFPSRPLYRIAAPDAPSALRRFHPRCTVREAKALVCPGFPASLCAGGGAPLADSALLAAVVPAGERLTPGLTFARLPPGDAELKPARARPSAAAPPAIPEARAPHPGPAEFALEWRGLARTVRLDGAAPVEAALALAGDLFGVDPASVSLSCGGRLLGRAYAVSAAPGPALTVVPRVPAADEAAFADAGGRLLFLPAAEATAAAAAAHFGGPLTAVHCGCILAKDACVGGLPGAGRLARVHRDGAPPPLAEAARSAALSVRRDFAATASVATALGEKAVPCHSDTTVAQVRAAVAAEMGAPPAEVALLIEEDGGAWLPADADPVARELARGAKGKGAPARTLRAIQVDPDDELAPAERAAVQSDDPEAVALFKQCGRDREVLEVTVRRRALKVS